MMLTANNKAARNAKAIPMGPTEEGGPTRSGKSMM
jgi:hypothetical protein